MQKEKPCCAAAAARMIKKITLSDGCQVGIANLEDLLQEVAGLKLVEAAAIKKELLERTKAHNYVVAPAEEEYATALFAEYERQYAKGLKTRVDL